MNWRRALVFFLWAGVCLFLSLTFTLLTQMGDCFDVKECNDYKDRVMRVLLFGAPAVWLLGVFFMMRRWSR